MSKKALVALSGCVDSAVWAYILKERGYEVTGIMLHLYDKPDSIDLEDAKSVCEKLNIPLVNPDYRQEFRELVINRFAEDYVNGKTPNPCVDCNRYVKLPFVFKYAEEKGFDYVATGHYARVKYDENRGKYLLLRGEDRKKDQSYVLYNLKQKELSRLLLPIGEISKDEVRKIAESQGFSVAHKSDSQDICFIEGDYYDFLKSECGVTLIPGDFINKDGRVLGKHKGAVCYTRGQRKGLGLALPEPMYVVAKDMEKNTVTLGFNDDLMSCEVLSQEVNLISVDEINEPLEVTSKVRYNQVDTEAVATMENSLLKVVFKYPQRAVTEGQSLVLYRGDEVLGGGKII